MALIKRECRHGVFSFKGGDEFVGLSFLRYGEYAEHECDVFRRVLQPGDTAIDAGANIGPFTIPMAKLVGPEGRVIAFEAGRENAEILRINVAANECHNVRVIAKAVSSRTGVLPVSDDVVNYIEIGKGSNTVEAMPIDDLKLDKLKLIKLDVEGHEREALIGARETIKRCQPIIYLENDRDDKSAALIGELVDQGYKCFWHRPWYFNVDNYAKNKKNIFGNIVAIMMLCVPEDSNIVIQGCEEVADLRDDEELFTREIKRYTRRVERKPDDLEARLLCAHYHSLMQHSEQADALLAENLRRDPEHVPSRAIRSMWLLQRGEWKRGWEDYELRFQQPVSRLRGFGGHRMHIDARKWNGEQTDERVLIWSEQGYGDSIMCSRFFRHVLKRAPNAVLEVQPQLHELFEQSGIAPGALYRLGRSLPDYPLHCSLLSVPAALGADENLIRIDAPYLFADPMMVANWQGRGNVTTGTMPISSQIGLCSVGSARSERSYTRNLPGEMVNKLSEQHGPFFDLHHSGQFESFADTAAAIMTLDLVITVDTSIAHLAGALGVPTWLLLSFDPDFRWGLKGEQSLWYPSIRIFRQPKFRDWASVIDDVSRALTERANVTRAAA